MTSNNIHDDSIHGDDIYYDEMDSPVGSLRLVADRQGLREIWFEHERHPKQAHANWIRATAPLQPFRRQLDEYFAGQRRHFDLLLHPLGTPFQLTVWQALRRIPYGSTISYGELARRIGKPRAMRAVGAANGRNPLPIVVPCHRVIGADGSLTGFGGGLPTKRCLLTLEHALPADDLFATPTHEASRVLITGDAPSAPAAR